ncbi:4 TM domain-containing transmembrane protein Cdc6d [Acrasis kona]|uniref:4 TM domain-containing transmembrane protein Cdc6d n=1 Tax=Acrasis kona TaxID=1008807 RepID=A0AAW2ZEJ3_9EUKA
MDYLVDTLTRAPSQVLVKSATTFGEEAARILGAVLEETIKNCTDDVTNTVTDNTKIITKALVKIFDRFGTAFKETGVEGFTEWGIAIERAFLHVGSKMESGLTNSSGKLVAGIRESVEDGGAVLNTTIKDSIKDVTEKFGVEQVKQAKKTFDTEIKTVIFCIVIITFGLFTWLLSNSLHNGLTSWVFSEFKTICFLIFSLLNGYALYTWNRTMEKTEKPLDSPRVLFFVIAGLSFFAGNLCQQISYFPSLNMLICFVVMAIVALVVCGAASYDLLFKVYSMYKSIQEFRQWKQQKEEANESFTNLKTDLKFKSASTSPVNIISDPELFASNLFVDPVESDTDDELSQSPQQKQAPTILTHKASMRREDVTEDQLFGSPYVNSPLSDEESSLKDPTASNTTTTTTDTTN